MALKLLVYIVIACIYCRSIAAAKLEHLNEAYPAPFSKSNRILSMVVAFSLNRLDPLMHSFRAQQNMCEGGWDTTLVIFTTLKVSLRMRKYIESKLYCYRTQVK